MFEKLQADFNAFQTLWTELYNACQAAGVLSQTGTILPAFQLANNGLSEVGTDIQELGAMLKKFPGFPK